ncbi:MAG: arsenate reductase (glutaredoxin) [Bacteroidia bacterium]|nr:arsenate reductase (glutaredoxin) [Bacteroidia bacterium]
MKIYHNPRCTTSCKTLELLKSIDENPEVLDYIKNPPTVAELNDLIEKLGIKPFEIVRQKEKIYIENYKDKNFTDKEWIQILSDNPRLIQRPIIINGDKAVIGRPPENILKLKNKV